MQTDPLNGPPESATFVSHAPVKSWLVDHGRSPHRLVGRTDSRSSPLSALSRRYAGWGKGSETVAGPVPRTFQYMSKNMRDRSQIQLSHQASNSKSHTTNVANYIHTIKNCQRATNDLSVVLICLGHVLRRTKPSKEGIL
jgi:hypothetical protein